MNEKDLELLRMRGAITALEQSFREETDWLNANLAYSNPEHVAEFHQHLQDLATLYRQYQSDKSMLHKLQNPEPKPITSLRMPDGVLYPLKDL